MVKTRARAQISPRTPLSDKVKKVGARGESPSASPSVKALQVKKKKKETNKKTKDSSKLKKANELADKEAVNEKLSSVIPEKVIAKAISELAKFVNKESENSNQSSLLLDEENDDLRDLLLQINTKKFCSSKPEFKPKVIKLTMPLYDLSNVNTCLIVRDQLVTTEELLESIEDAKIPTLSKIYTLSQIKTEFKNFEKRRELYSSYDLFVVDDALLSMMPTILGKIFYGKKGSKGPLPIRTCSTNSKELSVTTIKNQIEKCLHSTYYLPPMGTNISVRFGKTSNNENMLIANLNNILSAFDIGAIKSIMVKTIASPSLPLFYTDKLYDEASDITKEHEDSKTKTNGVNLTRFEQELLEIGDPDEVSKLIGKKLKKQHDGRKKSLVKNKVHKRK
ncbi:uncharacterized protein PRCAT00006295001 [Priceomyces carsonii]|uniref:uncharacterized protein n=1 Tax=Priceomyces carsonii TaxID=28549 RepID=UPI002EDA8170|nr:unnamed protein product [Priceomyces carsonii]